MRSQTPDLVWPAEYEKAQKKVDAVRAQLAKATAKLDAVRKQALIKCCHCQKTYPIAEQTYIQTYWYTPPSGCTDGDYWNDGEANWKCPGCGFKNRFDNRPTISKYSTAKNAFYRPELIKLERFFKRTRDCYCDYRRICDECRKEGGKTA